MTPDLHFVHHGRLVLLHPLTPAGKEWCATHLDPEAQTFGRAIVIEPRYAGDIADGADEAGLLCAWTLH
jgi:hypothetical protein